MKSQMSKFVSDRESPLSRLSQSARNSNDCLVTIARNAGGSAIERLLSNECAKFPRDRLHIEVSRVAYRQVSYDLLGQSCGV